MRKVSIPKRMRQTKIPLRHQLLERKEQVTPWRAWRLWCSLYNKMQMVIAAKTALEYRQFKKELPFDDLEMVKFRISICSPDFGLVGEGQEEYLKLLDAPSDVLYRIIENTSEYDNLSRRDSDLYAGYERVVDSAEYKKPRCWWTTR